MNKHKVAILGSGNGGLTMAGDFALAGHTVNLFELERFKSSLDPVIEAGGIEMRGVTREGFAELNMVTTNMKEALDGVEVICVVTPAYGHKPFAEAMASHLEDGQMITLNPGYSFGCVETANVLKEKGVDLKKILLGATQILVYATRKYLGYKVFCGGVKAKVPFAAFPGKNTEKMIPTLNEIYPEDDGERGVIIPVRNELKTTLENINLFGHPPMMILKAVDIELGEEPYLKSRESHAVKMLRRAMDCEAGKITEAFGLEHWSNEYIHDVLMYPYWLKRPRTVGRPEWATPENLPVEYRAPSNLLKMRYVTEDLPYGLVPISQLGDMVNIPTPAIDSVITIGSIISQTDFWTSGRTLENLGLAGMSKVKLLEYLDEG